MPAEIKRTYCPVSGMRLHSFHEVVMFCRCVEFSVFHLGMAARWTVQYREYG